MIPAAVDARGRAGGGDRGRLVRLREPGGRGQPQRRAHGGAARGPARVGRGRDRQPALRIGARRRSSAPATRSLAGDGDLFVAGGVESMSRAPLVTAKPDAAVSARRPDALRHDARLALPEPAAGGAVPARDDGRDGRERRRALRRHPRGAGRVRAALAAALGGGGRGGPLRRRARPGRRGRARRAPAAGHERRRSSRRCKPAFREGGTVTAGNASGHQRRCSRARDRVARRRHASSASSRSAAFVGSAVAGVDPRVMGIGPVPAVRKLLERPGVAVDELDLRRAERGVRLAEPAS